MRTLKIYRPNRMTAAMSKVIVEIDGKKYLDGGCADSVPVEAFQKMGYEKNVIVLTRPAGYRKKPEHSKLAKLVYRKYPNFVKALTSRADIYNRTMKKIEEMELDIGLD